MIGTAIPLTGGFLRVGRIVFDKTAKAHRRAGALSEAVEGYRRAVNPLKHDIQRIEVKGGKDLDDTLQFMAEEKVVPKQDRHGRMVTLEEADLLQDKKDVIDTRLAESLDDVEQKNDLNLLREKAKNELRASNLPDLDKRLEDVDALIDGELSRRGGRSMITDRELHNVKNVFWSTGYDFNRATRSPTAKKLGFLAKSLIHDNNPDVNIRAVNELSGQFADAIALLKGIHGNVVKGGKLGGWFNSLLFGFIFDRVLNQIPILKALAIPFGHFVGKYYNQFLTDPERIVRLALKKMRQSGVEPRANNILKEFEAALWKRETDKKFLPAPRTNHPPETSIIRLPRQGIAEGQALLREGDRPGAGKATFGGKPPAPALPYPAGTASPLRPIIKLPVKGRAGDKPYKPSPISEAASAYVEEL